MATLTIELPQQEAQREFNLRRLASHGRTLTECPISTADGVKAADVAWASPDRMAEPGDHVCFPRARKRWGRCG